MLWNTYKQRSTLRTKIRKEFKLRSEELKLDGDIFELNREERRERIETEKKEMLFCYNFSIKY